MKTIQSLVPSCTTGLVVLAAILCAGCASDGVRQQSRYDRDSRHTQERLLAAGDADSLAAAALWSIGPKFEPEQRLALIARAVEKAPDRADLVWLNIQLCVQVGDCDPEPIEARLRALDPANGAGWYDSIVRAGLRHDVAAVRRDLAAMATSTRIDTYWNAIVVHATNAILETHTMDLPTAFLASIGAAAGTIIPPYLSIVNACKGDSLQDPEVLASCRQVSATMRGGDTYATEMVGIAIAMRVWPEDSAQYLDAASAKRVAHYRLDTEATIHGHYFRFSRLAARRLRLMAEKRTEQEVMVAEILDARLSPNPPANWIDR